MFDISNPHFVAHVLGALAIVLAFGFEFVNGFHDSANAVATVIYSGALRRGQAIAMSAAMNLIGAVTVGTGVAMFVTKVVPASVVSLPVIIAALIGSISWNLYTWWRGIPVSSSHCLLGGLLGAGMAAAGWNGFSMGKVEEAFIALVTSPLAGLAVAFVITFVIAWLRQRQKAQAATLVDGVVDPVLGLLPGKKKGRAASSVRWLQIASAASVSFGHGANDGQKTMGLVTLILATAFADQGFGMDHVPWPVVGLAALAMALGTMTGGTRVIQFIGDKLSGKAIDTTHGCVAEFTTAAIVSVASHFGLPVSTTHVLNASVVGGTVGLHGRGHTGKSALSTMLIAWVITIPISAAVSYGVYWLAHTLLAQYGF